MLCRPFHPTMDHNGRRFVDQLALAAWTKGTYNLS